MTPLPFVPQPPDYVVPWTELDAAYQWVRDLRGCAQNPKFHAEGDVWTHTRMVLESLCGLPAWRALPEDDRAVVFWGALLHDVGKPAVSRTEEGVVTSRGHSRRGDMLARSVLWRLGVDPLVRERVCALVHLHQAPFFLIDRDDAERAALRISWRTRCDLLALLAEADARGRICGDLERILDNVELFWAFCDERGCLSTPYVFASDHQRFLYLRGKRDWPGAPAHVDFRCTVTLMSGLPGSGKDRWIARNRAGLPMVSLDGIRRELGVSPTSNQGTVVQIARKRSREFLRAGQDFVFNATNLRAERRGPLIDLFADYDARVEIVAVEVPFEVHERQNAEREDSVPRRVIERMVEGWQAPTADEGHSLVVV